VATRGWIEQDVLVDGVRVHVRRTPARDDAVPIVHLHGFAISGAYLVPTAERLAARAENLVPDLPGYGRSADPPRPLTIPERAATVHRLLDVLDLDRVVLVGNSMGCPIAIEAAHARPLRIAGVVLVSPAGGAQNQPLLRGVGQLALDAVREKPSMAPTAARDYLRFGPRNAWTLFREMVAYPSLDRLLTLPVPALAVLGSRDPLMPSLERARAVARSMPAHVDLVCLEGAAHAVNYSHPGELAHVIGCWLDAEPITDDPTQPGLARIVRLGD
jgi:pimeloyl-ACP methyl ester carboxylesterase